MGGIEPSLIERFRADFLRVLGRDLAPHERIALAVSGGPDSMAMLALGAAAFPRQVVAATVDHRLRPESADEAAMVARACRALDVPHATLAIAAPKGASGNLHAWARQERYALLYRWATDHGSPTLSTAHHAEDQAETFLMRAARASGLSGLAAVRERRETGFGLREMTRTEQLADGGAVITVHRRPITLLRPLLRWRRAELRTTAEASGLPFTDDPSNHDERFDRARFRRWLEAAEGIDPAMIARSAEHVADAEADLRAVAEWLWKVRSLPSGDHEERFDVADLPRGVKRYIARLAIFRVSEVGIAGPEQLGSIEHLLDALDAGRSATHAGVMASAKGTVWHFREAPPRRTG